MRASILRFAVLALGMSLAGCVSQKSVAPERPIATISISHARSAAMGWELKIEAKAADSRAKLLSANIRVNGSPISNGDPRFSDALDAWTGEYHNVGVFPGDNKVDIAVTDIYGNITRSQHQW